MARAPERWVAGLRAFGAHLARCARPLWALAALAWMGLIWGLSSRPDTRPGGHAALALLHNLGHAPLFGLLAACWALSLPRSDGWPRFTRGAVTLVLLLTLTFAGVDEWHQGRVPGRDASIFDLLTDLCGAASVLWIAGFLARGDARDGALGLRLALGTAACAAAAALATWPPVAIHPFAGL